MKTPVFRTSRASSGFIRAAAHARRYAQVEAIRVTQKCYMCDGRATTDEHVPPKCLFPEEKDLPKEVSLRVELIKVPSCELHNTAKSKDDEYLLYVLCMNIANNAVAFQHF